MQENDSLFLYRDQFFSSFSKTKKEAIYEKTFVDFFRIAGRLFESRPYGGTELWRSEGSQTDHLPWLRAA